jgi:RNA polymerase sigma-70 factor (ECF subfamily)
MERWGARTGVERDEGKLVQRCLAGDQEACTDLVQGYARMVGTVIWRATGDDGMVEDLAQDTFLRVFRGLAYFDARAKLSTWIYTIAHRVAIDHLRKLGRVREEPDELLRTALPASGVLDPEATATREEIDRLVRDGLAQLPDKYRLPLVYAAIDGLDYETIGVMLGVPPGTVKTLVFRGKRMLKDRILATLAAHTAGNEVSDAL